MKNLLIRIAAAAIGAWLVFGIMSAGIKTATKSIAPKSGSAGKGGQRRLSPTPIAP